MLDFQTWSHFSVDEYLEGNWLGNCTDPKSVYESSTLSMNDLIKSSGPLKYFPIAETHCQKISNCVPKIQFSEK